MRYGPAVISNVRENRFHSRRAIKLKFVPRGALVQLEVASGPYSDFVTAARDALPVEIFRMRIRPAAYVNPATRRDGNE